VEQQLLQYVSVVWSREVYHFVVTSFSSRVAASFAGLIDPFSQEAWFGSIFTDFKLYTRSSYAMTGLRPTRYYNIAGGVISLS
jgi:hypothetical protein